MSTAISTYSKSDYINFIVLMVLGFLVIPMTVSSDYWFTSILIPWLCLALATIGQQVIMGYNGQLALGAAGFILHFPVRLIYLVHTVFCLGYKAEAEDA